MLAIAALLDCWAGVLLVGVGPAVVGLTVVIEVCMVTLEDGLGVEWETVVFMLVVETMVVLFADGVGVGLGVYAEPVPRCTVVVPLEVVFFDPTILNGKLN